MTDAERASRVRAEILGALAALHGLTTDPEMRAAGVALVDAARWLEVRQAVDAAAVGQRARGLAWEEI